MDVNNMIKELMTAIGGLVEVMGAFYKELSKQGFNEQEKLYLTGEFMKTMLPGGSKK